MKKLVLFILCFIILIPEVKAIDVKKGDLLEVEFEKCTDGDTATFKKGEETIKVRFLAVDTPETKHPTKGEEPYGKEASNFTCKSIKNAKNIVLEFDEDSDVKDKYDRYLAWIFIDDTLLQKQLIEKGYAKVAYLYGDYKYTSDLKTTEKVARKNQIGLWGEEPKDYTIYYIIGGVILLIILGIIIKKTTNKNIKSTARKTNTKVKSVIKKLIKKI